MVFASHPKKKKKIKIQYTSINQAGTLLLPNINRYLKRILIQVFFNVKTSLAGLFKEKCSQKALRPFWNKSKQLKNDFEKCYSPSGNKVKKYKISSISVTVLLRKSRKVKKVLKKRYGVCEKTLEE